MHELFALSLSSHPFSSHLLHHFLHPPLFSHLLSHPTPLFFCAFPLVSSLSIHLACLWLALHKLSVVNAGGKTGSHRMQELKYFRGGATLVISMDGLNWLSKRRCSDKGLQKRDEELHLWIPSAQMIQVDEEQQPLTCFCILDQSSTLKSWRNTDCRSASLCLSSQQCCPLKKPVHQSAFTSIHPFVTDFPKEVAWTKLILNMRDIIGLITKYLNMATHQDTITMHPSKKCVMFYDDFIPALLFNDLYFTQDCRIFLGHTGCHIGDNNNVSVNLKNSITYCHLGPNTDFEDDHSETDVRDNLNLRSLLKSCEYYNHPGKTSGRDGNVKLRKSVSFDEDVMVYLFDKESPTLDLQSEPCTSQPSSNSCNLPSVTLEDSGLEWEDDFSALEKNCHFQHCTLSLPKQSWTSLPRTERCSVSQKCLFLTYVTESDLEL